jgi:hypothetical protein
MGFHPVAVSQYNTVTDLLKALRNSGHAVPQRVTSVAIAQR